MNFGKCFWQETEWGIWEAKCTRNEFEFNDGGPEENDFKFCPYCGQKLVSLRREED